MASLTRQHFVALAYEAKWQRPEAWDKSQADRSDWERGACDEWATFVLGLAGVLHQFNGGFDWARFLRACGYASEPARPRCPRAPGGAWDADAQAYADAERSSRLESLACDS